ncbi:MAG: hypothetical protein ACOX5G_02795 [Kiritimatiellia bacterium]|jgi:hypothetical protein
MTPRPLLALLAAALLAGCASTYQYVPLPDQGKTVEDPAKARIYIVRPSALASAMPLWVTDGTQLIGMTGTCGYLCWERPPGDATIKSEVDDRTATLPLKTEAGGVYYVLQHNLITHFKLSLLTEQEGKQALTKCKPPQIAK